MVKKIQAWCQLQIQRLREHGVRQRIKASIKKILKMLLRPCFEYIQKRPHTKKIILNILRSTGLIHRVKRLLVQDYPIQLIPLTARALEIKQELKQRIKLLEKTI